ncbi:Dipeptidyl-peptidase 5 [Vermiconidia calcicola]|uniref:Dipeptidyl-peptidase 5 n=1 Tax=Vermiconidia calcicola TaxID=1690605 RepID=A0ACC3MPP1_9PEZI|nr:Dipeptidyl-peptidase 5 [Vermiconidia calcicola]
MVRTYFAAVAALLMPVVLAITPKQMISAPRYSSASANRNGEWAVFTSETYSFAKHESTLTWNLMRVSTGEITELPFEDDVSEMVWAGETPTSVLYVSSKSRVSSGVSLWTADLADSPINGTRVANLPAPYSGLKAVLTDSGDINFLLNCLAYKNGTAYNADLAPVPYTTGRLYESIYVRHWTDWVTEQRYAVFAGSLSSSGSSYDFDGSMTNLLTGIDAPVTRPESPVQPYGGSSDYDLSSDGSTVVFLTKAPELSKANYTASYLYLVPHDGSSVAQQLNGPGTEAPSHARGASGAPLFSPDGSQIAYYQQDGVAYESDRSKIYVADVESGSITPVAENWDASAAVIKWSSDASDLYVASDYWGSTRLFIIPSDAGANYKPTNITDITSVSDYYVMPNGDALVTSTAVWSSHNVYTVTPDAETNYLYRANEEDAELSGLGPDDLEWIWYEGTLGDQQQALIVYPTDFDPNEVYDLLFYVHGGPQGYTGNTWSTRWNLRTWADQGYVLFGPNPTGSTSYGQDLTDRIQGKWGSWPYEDLINAHSWACDNLAYINCSNAIAAGASYGGYMMNWIQGHDFSDEFNALVSHDGVTSTLSIYETEELWFIEHDLNGTMWDSREVYEMNDPLMHIKNFSTPQFVVQNDLDFRLPADMGIMMFNILQELGIPSRFLNFPDEGHWVGGQENSLFWHQEIFNWINYWSGKIPSLDNNAVTE